VRTSRAAWGVTRLVEYVTRVVLSPCTTPRIDATARFVFIKLDGF
jgi:hypothetical protein